MRTPEEVLVFILGLLAEFSIPYMIVGSYASNYYGRPRATNDADVIVWWVPDQIDRFVEKLGREFYADTQDLKDSISQGRMSNLIHFQTGFKIDLSPLGAGDYQQQAFARRKETKLWGQAVYFASPEDIILLKLMWAKQGQSQRQVEDAKGISQVQGAALDRGYIKRWAAALSVTDLWEKIA